MRTVQWMAPRDPSSQTVIMHCLLCKAPTYICSAVLIEMYNLMHKKWSPLTKVLRNN